MSFTNNDIAKVTLTWQVAGIGFQCNVFQARLGQEAPHNVSDAVVIADLASWMDDIYAPMVPHIVVPAVPTGVLVHKRVGLEWWYIGMGLPTFDPENAGDPLPSGVAALITAFTNVSKVRGRKFILGLSEGACNVGAWSVGVLAAMADSALAWVLPFYSSDPGSSWIPGVYHLKGMAFVSFNYATNIPDIPAYQRRRKEGVGI